MSSFIIDSRYPDMTGIHLHAPCPPICNYFKSTVRAGELDAAPFYLDRLVLCTW